MRVLITGAAGMIGRKLAKALAAHGQIGGRDISALVLADMVPAELPDGASGSVELVNLADPLAASTLIAKRPDVIFHLAAVVSGQAEAEFATGYDVNLSGTIALLRAIADQMDDCPRFVFASSIAVFGAPLPDPIPDDHPRRPLTSYGTQKAMGEMMVDDLSRRGLIEGISLRLPTICVRPGKPNAAASGFFSGILREPLMGQEAILPVSEDTRHWFASPRAAVGFLRHAAGMDLTPLGQCRALSLPGVAASVGEQIAALERVAGPKAVALIRREPDETIQKIVGNWPRSFDPACAHALGFKAEADMDTILRAHIEDELRGHIPVRDG